MSEPSITDAITSELMGPPPTTETPEGVSTPAPETPTPDVSKPDTTEPLAATQPAPVTTASGAPATPASLPPPGWIPVEVAQDLRAKVRERDQRIAEFESQQANRQIPIPDPTTQPEEFAAYLDRRDAEITRRVEIKQSARSAIQQHTNEKVQEAAKWGVELGPDFQNWFLAQPDPFGWLMQQYQRHQLAEQVGSDPDAFVRKRFAELNATESAPLATGQAQAVQTPTIPLQQTAQPVVPRSIASQPTAGTAGGVIPSDEQMFDEAVLNASRPKRKRGSG